MLKFFFYLKKECIKFSKQFNTYYNRIFNSQGFQKRGFNIDNSKIYQYELPKNVMRLMDDVGHFDFSLFVYMIESLETIDSISMIYYCYLFFYYFQIITINNNNKNSTTQCIYIFLKRVYSLFRFFFLFRFLSLWKFSFLCLNLHPLII